MRLISNKNIFKIILNIFTVLMISSCSRDIEAVSLDDAPQTGDQGSEPEEIINDLENPSSTTETDLGVSDFFDEANVYDGYILVNDAASNSAYLMDKRSKKLFDFELNTERIGNDVQLLPDGRILAMLESKDPLIKFGGFGGLTQILDKDGMVEWSYEYSTEDYISHHDAELLPNGNVLIQIWERKTAAQATAAGYALDVIVFPDGLIEVNTSTNEIVWEWRAWDHLIQNHDDTQSHFGIISDNPQLIDINYISDEKGDIMHANGISYDSKNDLIYLSANFFSEVWVIDHSTTTIEAATNQGGAYGKGGDLIYRFGNPEAYQNSIGERRFDHNHYPNLLSGQDEGKMLIFSNGFTEGKSTVYELQLPSNFDLKANTNNEPQVLWSFTNDSLFSPKVSGAVKLPNGNRLITEGDRGFWEVNQKGKVVWRFKGAGFFWRGYHFDTDSPAIKSLEL